MLSKPEYGWTDFQLGDSAKYRLSYLDDIAFEWTEQAIHGLKTMSPFCVKGFMEPGRFLCLVSYWNCHIIREDDGKQPLDREDVKTEYVHVSMIDFCRELYKDINGSIAEWSDFMMDFAEDEELVIHKKEMLEELLAELKTLIEQRQRSFGENYCFL